MSTTPATWLRFVKSSVLLLALTSIACKDFYQDAHCDAVPEANASCGTLTAAGTLPPRLVGNAVGPQSVWLDFLNLADNARPPTVTLTSSSGLATKTADVVSRSLDERWAATFNPPSPGSVLLPLGPATLTLTVGIRSAAPPGSTMVYSMPQLRLLATKSYSMPAERALAVSLQTMPGESRSSIFVTEETVGAPTRQALERYYWQGGALVSDPTFVGKTQVGVAPANSPSLFTTNRDSAFMYTYFGTSWVLGAVDLDTPMSTTDNMVRLQRATCFASDPSSRFHVLWGGDSTSSNLEVFQFGTGTGMKAQHVPISSTPLVNRKDEEPYLLAARTFVLDSGQIDFVTINAKYTVGIYSISGPNITRSDSLSTTATALVKAARSDAVSNGMAAKLDALAIGDLDRDGYPDLVLAIEDLGCSIGTARGSVCQLTVLPYLRGGTFGESFAVQLADPIRDPVLGIAVGDLDGDSIPDVAMVTATALTVYRNTAP